MESKLDYIKTMKPCEVSPRGNFDFYEDFDDLYEEYRTAIDVSNSLLVTCQQLIREKEQNGK